MVTHRSIIDDQRQRRTCQLIEFGGRAAAGPLSRRDTSYRVSGRGRLFRRAPVIDRHHQRSRAKPLNRLEGVAGGDAKCQMPIVAQQLARSGQYQVLITLGAVIRGDTPHFDVVVAEASKGIAAVARDTSVPVIFGVLTTDTMQQALERAGIKSNLGWSYGLEALEMGSLMRALPSA